MALIIRNRVTRLHSQKRRGIARALTLGASSFKGCQAISPPGKFKILYRVSKILKNRGSPILEVRARRIYETIKLIENRNDFFSNSKYINQIRCFFIFSGKLVFFHYQIIPQQFSTRISTF